MVSLRFLAWHVVKRDDALTMRVGRDRCATVSARSVAVFWFSCQMINLSAAKQAYYIAPVPPHVNSSRRASRNFPASFANPPEMPAPLVVAKILIP
jgi:hypothetical protein